MPTEAAFEKVSLDDNTANPMKLAVAPDGKVFYTELGGALKLYHPDTQSVSTAANVPVYRGQENGLIGVALDNDFDTNNYIYLFYSDPGTMQVDGVAGGVQHVSRFTFDPSAETLDMDSEVVLLEIPHQRVECCHSAGHMEFDSEGNLYISTGDDTNPFASSGYGPFDFRDGRQPWDAARSSANTADLRGKILRINPIEEATSADAPGLGSTYTVPDDNLFPTSEYDPAVAFPEIYIMGLRNPFTLDVDNAPDQGGTDWLSYGQVGPDANNDSTQRGARGYDYWNVVQDAANYGWPFCVVNDDPYRRWDFATSTPGTFYDCLNGPVNDSPNNDGLEQLPAVPREPSIFYPYCGGDPGPYPEVPCPGGGRAAYAGDIYHYDSSVQADGQFPAYYDDTTFVMEWERDFIATIDLTEDGEYVDGSLEEMFQSWRGSDDLRLRKPHDMEFGPDGSMYLIEWGDEFNFGGGGVNPDSGLYRISYVKGGRTPVAVASATPDAGQPPLEVSFSSVGSEDPDGDEMTYAWDFGNGETSTEANPTYTYTDAGTYTAQLVVTDETGRSSSSNVTITVGNSRPEVTLVLPENGQVFEWGDDIPYEVTVTDPEDGSTDDGGIDCADVLVQSGVFHDTGGSAHVHGGTLQSGCEGVISTQQESGHEDSNVTVIVTASYTDSGGTSGGNNLTGGTSSLMRPAHTEAEHFSDQSGLDVGPSNDSDGGTDAISGANGDWAEYDPVNLDAGPDTLTLRASSTDDTTVEVRRDAPDGELLGTAEIESTTSVERVEGQTGFGDAVRFNGPSSNQYAELPEGVVSGLDADFTIATWVNRASTGQEWSRIFDFGTGTNTNMFLTPNAGGAAGLRFAITDNGNANEELLTTNQELGTGWHHVAVTLSGTTGTLWLDGAAVATNANMTLSPGDLGNTDQNWLIRSQYAADPYLNATLDEFHIYDRALDQSEVQDLMASPASGHSGAVVAYDFDGDGGTITDASGNGNDGNIVLSGNATSWTNVPVELADTSGSFPMYLVFPGSEASVNWIQFGEVDSGGECEEPGSVSDSFSGSELDECRWDRIVRPEPSLLDVSGGQLHPTTTSLVRRVT